jgi:ABC-type phosphate transport system auxiliary subunit
MKKLWGYIVGAFGILLGMLFYERTKRKSAEALNDNLETKEAVLKKQAEIEKNNAGLSQEELNRKKILEDQKGKNEDLSISNIVDFFNRRK